MSIMEFEEIRPFLESNHRGVVMTFQKDGAIQSSIIVCGAYQYNVAFVSIRGNSRKVHNLRRNPKCSVLAVSSDWRGYATVEGTAQLFDSTNMGSEELRVLLRDVYNACGDSEHPNWDEYDTVMRDQNEVVVFVRPERIYGLLR